MPQPRLARSHWPDIPDAAPRRRAVIAAAGLGMAGGLVLSPAIAQAPVVTSLPPPRRGEAGSLQAALAQRRSVRSYSTQALTLADVSDLLWAAQGISSDRGLRTAPSAGALYPLTLYVVSMRVDGLAEGVYRYVPSTHAVDRTPGDATRTVLERAAGGQTAIASAALVLAIAATHARTAAKYGARASRYVAFEAGAAAQNFALKAAAMGLGTVVMGAFDDDAVARLLRLPAGVQPLALMPVGRP